ncbi:putative quinol monooxygenase [Micromonospora cathayae]|uniref:Antibiotic biosynthesis monooxygenase n=1 Tax=Micromonospora cathayae TaxID=3028804 RepID=A0ABY7ZU85_9ACTN|nr:antibiotic biosynthesis monooxygenase [Micromonospora sp. HUAS 3]WDZ86599.1 antibiotic biosynthesis monooxygenase [Micromonospora sp. HUAS 3]
MTVSYGFHATMTAQPGRGDELVGFLLASPSLAHEDCVVFLVGRSAADPDVVHVTEGWTSEETHHRFFATAEAQGLVARLQPLIAGEPEYRDEVPVGGRAAL